VNPQRNFRAELKKQQQGAKVLSTSSLRQNVRQKRHFSEEYSEEFVEHKKRKEPGCSSNSTQTTLILPHGVRMTLTALAKHIFDSSFGGQNPVDDKTRCGTLQDSEGFRVKRRKSQTNSFGGHI
jgi:hypothetical protein